MACAGDRRTQAQVEVLQGVSVSVITIADRGRLCRGQQRWRAAVRSLHEILCGADADQMRQNSLRKQVIEVKGAVCGAQLCKLSTYTVNRYRGCESVSFAVQRSLHCH